MSADSQDLGGIRARRIEADNVVSGIQIQGEATNTANWAPLAQTTQHGGINADEIIASSVVQGFQYITNPATATINDLQRELTAFRTRLEQAIAAKELLNQDDAQDAKQSLEAAQEELAKSQPNGQRLIRKLNDLDTIVTKSAEIAQATGRMGAIIVQLAPVASSLWQIGRHLFGL